MAGAMSQAEPVFTRRQPSCSLTCELGCKQWTGCKKWRDAHPEEPYEEPYGQDKPRPTRDGRRLTAST
jgi:hypothetical protein